MERHERHHIQRAYPGMHPCVPTQIDVVSGESRRINRRLRDSTRIPHVCDHTSVVIGVGGPIQDLNTRSRDRVDQGLDL
jgi:hypothetical protein